MDVGTTLSLCLVAGVFVPLLMFLILAFGGPRLGKPGASVPAILGILSSLGLSSFVLVKWLGMNAAERLAAGEQAISYHWAALGDIDIYAAVKLDSLSIIIFFMVTLVSSCIFIFSRGYMTGRSDEVDGTSKYHRFFAFLSLFAFSMLGLVISANLVFLFIFWELVGLCSYFLIGFYFDKKFASDAAMKAFIVNRVGDFGFMVGLACIVVFLKDVSIDGAAAVFASQYASQTGIFDATLNIFGWHIHGYTVATFMGVCLFCGCIGKSAQVPLQVWLPDAMAGPTPVSALIHAATMVAAGVYLVARIFPLLTPDAQSIIAVIGCVTLTMAALIAMVQTDIKKVLAYSTLSQLGYMVFGLGVGAWVAALFHLITHAFFKAMMFLGSGQVIEGCHHEQDIRKMGGLYKKMPVTCWTFFVGVLAISGVGLPAMNTVMFAGVGGYYSKDEILAVAYYRAYGDAGDSADPRHGDGGHADEDSARHASLASFQHDELAPEAGHAEETHASTANAHLLGSDRLPMLPKWLFWLPIIIAYVTPFYMMRVWWLTFMGKPRDEHIYEHAHESPLMKWPLVILAIGTLWSSWFLFRGLIADAAPAAAGSAALIAPLDGHEPPVHDFASGPLTKIVWASFIVGFFLAFVIYRRGLKTADRICQLPIVGQLHSLLWHKFYFDEFYNLFVVGGTRLIARISSFLDKWILDFSIVENLARLTKALAMFSGRVLDARGVDRVVTEMGRTAFDFGDLFRVVQTGRIRNYVIFSATAALLFVVTMILI
ncbi:MAG: NADH-quinone oxidoreductase subunit L [Planctomycetes bacterium]|nr:NADH-quinone oxidoreductase subunit L [Planctomycetota bacterium]